jgi:NAD(P)-dependent dehydrogenase (short-subunit alcohol dehydrogenase family)
MISLVTGTSTGIGRAVARALAAEGQCVVATVRNPEQVAELEVDGHELAGEIHGVVLDVTDEASARAVVADVIDQFGRLDHLINNAGAGRIGTLEQLDHDELEATMAINFGGVARMTRLVLPQMRAQRSGRIVTVTSVGGVVGQPFNDAYCAAKFAVEGLMESLAPVVDRFGIKVSLVEPGPVATAFTDNVMPEVVALMGRPDDPYAEMFNAYIAHVSGIFDQAQSPDDVAALIASVLESDMPRFRYQTSEWATSFVGAKLADLDGQSVQSMTTQWI